MYARCHSSISILHGSKLMFAQSILCSIVPTQLACQRDTASDIGSLEVPHLWVVLPAISMKFLHINEIPARKCAWRGSIFSFESHDLDNQKVNVLLLPSEHFWSTDWIMQLGEKWEAAGFPCCRWRTWCCRVRAIKVSYLDDQLDLVSTVLTPNTGLKKSKLTLEAKSLQLASRNHPGNHPSQTNKKMSTNSV